MALTQIRGEQIRDGIIKDRHVSSDAAISYSKLDLAGQIVASDLNGDGSVENAALDSKLITLWDMVQGIQSGTGSSVVVTTEILASAATDTPQTGVTAKGVLLTGTGTDGAGTTNYRVQIKNATTGEPIADGTDSDPGLGENAASVYAELRHDGTDYSLFFFDSNDQAYTFASDTELDILFLEVFSYLTAPAKGFIAGVGFADVVGIAGSHNHNDLYYTQTQLSSGQLDSRYYTETELNGGQLDNRYYTETELDPSAAATGDNVLDARYYRETELASSASGSSGASLIGVDAAAVTGLEATTIQGALVELQTDINAIIDGTTDISFSMDDTYNDGSVVTVDDTSVDFQLTDTKAFKVSDSTGTAIVEVDALAAGDTLGITADTTLTGDLSQSGGSVTLNAGAENVDVDGAAVTVDGSSIALASTGTLTLKDTNLTAGIPLSESGEAALEGYTATSIIGALNEAKSAASTALGIGAAEDATYEDGLFVDFVPATPVGTAVDRFNEVLKSLAPSPAPALTDIGTDGDGVSGALSFGTSNVIAGYTNHPTLDVGSAYTKSGDTMGIFANSGTIVGYLADNVVAQPNNRPYPARAFGNGDLGTLKLKVNGVEVHTVDLSAFASGSSVNANGSGFSLSAATSVKFDNGNDFDVFKYRTGTYVVNVADCNLGYNTIQIVHTTTGDSTTNTVNFVIDGDTTATSYSSEALSGLTMTGSKYISGVEYNTGGTVTYAIDADNIYRNTYSTSSSAVNFTGVNATIADKAITAPTTEADTLSLSETATISSASRLLDDSVSMGVQVSRTLQTTSTSTGASVSGILLDATADSATATFEPFKGETFRMNSSLSLTTTSGYTSGGVSPAEWDSSESLVGTQADHNTGLLIYNDTLRYPTAGLNSGDFSSVVNGPTNPDYSTASGNRTYYRYFYTSAAKSNFRLAMTAASTSFVSVATGPSGNNLTMEVLAPNTTSDGSTVEWKDATVSYTDDNSIGCYAATYGNSIPSNWGMTLGTKNTSTSGNVIVIKITASAGWTGNVSDITLTWL